jgi:hypothetical protein
LNSYSNKNKAIGIGKGLEQGGEHVTGHNSREKRLNIWIPATREVIPDSADQELPGDHCDEDYETYGVADQSSLLNLRLLVHRTQSTSIMPHSGASGATFFNGREKQLSLAAPVPPAVRHWPGFLLALHARHRV